MWLRTILAALCAAAFASPAAGAPAFPELHPRGGFEDCEPEGRAPICRIRRDLSEEEAQRRLEGRDVAWWAEGEEFTVVARHAGQDLRLCCAIQAPMARLPGTDLWTLTVRIPELEKAVLDIIPLRGPGSWSGIAEWRGPKAPAKAELAPTLAGEIREERLASRSLGAERGLTIYLPPEREPGGRLPVVYMADGESVPDLARAVEPLILSGRLPPVMLVGLHANTGVERHREYLPNWNGAGDAPFARHEAFLLQEAMPLAEQRYGASDRPEERMVMGYSNGAAWAVATALRNPTMFGRAAALSFAWPEAGNRLAGVGAKPKLFLAAGKLERSFLTRTRELAAVAGLAGYDVTLVTPVSGHSSVMWIDLYPQVMAWAFGPGTASARRPSSPEGPASPGQ